MSVVLEVHANRRLDYLFDVAYLFHYRRCPPWAVKSLSREIEDSFLRLVPRACHRALNSFLYLHRRQYLRLRAVINHWDMSLHLWQYHLDRWPLLMIDVFQCRCLSSILSSLGLLHLHYWHGCSDHVKVFASLRTKLLGRIYKWFELARHTFWHEEGLLLADSPHLLWWDQRTELVRAKTLECLGKLLGLIGFIN